MTTVTPAAATAPGGPTPTTSAASASTEGLAGDFNTFLTLLTAQLRNQDPLNPADSTEFVAQLAEFSGVEQQVKTNDRLDALIATIGDDAAASLSDWIGMEVRAAASAPYEGTPLSIEAKPVAGADLAILVIRDPTGAEAARLTVDPRASEILWDGTGPSGPLPEASYRFEIESYREGELVESRPAEVYAPVSEVRREDGRVILVLADGTRVDAETVGAMRAAS